ncbi:alpha/beta hydrolase [Flagellimonas allohymeniacidonis]|uniref:Alpha/beta hydrolase n=1 Tax=Flagellimonas allohymeniacidonis TaxID=2517819 RepID=A0A4V6MM99_9FLAO|nr:alpha/beta hydrolase-fold protein [Allomuricauda hymeniacidonis]TAI47600.1 alpha/beta hydrolase [Allomuricauda hymeniacidonis]
MSKGIPVFLILVLALCVTACNTKKQQSTEPEPTTAEVKKPQGYEIPRTQVVPIKNSRLGGQYELYIKLPESYSEHKDSIHPVIYFTDAIWHMDILSASAEYLMEDAVLVGISWQKDMPEDLLEEAGEHVSRYRDYSIKESSNPEHQAKYKFGQAHSHLNFIRNDVIPYVEKNYRTDASTRSYFGYSMGGNFGAFILMAKPDTFKNYILGSPTVDGDIALLSELGTTSLTKYKGFHANVFVSYGALEDELGPHVEEFVTMVKSKKDETLSLEHVVLEGSHQTVFPLAGVESVRWLSKITKE